MIDAALQTLRIAKKARCKARHKQMIILYNEGPNCGGAYNSSSDADEALEAITGANRERLTINTVYIYEYTSQPAAKNFGIQLAAANGGRFEEYPPEN